MEGGKKDETVFSALCHLQNLDNRVNAVVDALMNGDRNKWQTAAGLPTMIDSMVTHFQIAPYEFHWATKQAS